MARICKTTCTEQLAMVLTMTIEKPTSKYQYQICHITCVDVANLHVWLIFPDEEMNYCLYHNTVWCSGLVYARTRLLKYSYLVIVLSDCAQENITATDTAESGCAKLGSGFTRTPQKNYTIYPHSLLVYYVGQVVHEQAVTKWKKNNIK